MSAFTAVRAPAKRQMYHGNKCRFEQHNFEQPSAASCGCSDLIRSARAQGRRDRASADSGGAGAGGGGRPGRRGGAQPADPGAAPVPGERRRPCRHRRRISQTRGVALSPAHCSPRGVTTCCSRGHQMRAQISGGALTLAVAAAPKHAHHVLLGPPSCRCDGELCRCQVSEPAGAAAGVAYVMSIVLSSPSVDPSTLAPQVQDSHSSVISETCR